ncbi:hypothetical protein AVEN_154880-1 [Araneus ventricosus]|uniref:Uncharacterized protein n=1 Tax=Araneus ventricosus TaxID=182803 RepID=A0A4Y2A7K8_ARAVE|nr:hypothetical protein AVEN_154880-1 [Araneus ventricosus]
MCDTYSACPVITGLLVGIFGNFLFEIVIVICCLSENGTFGRPEAVLADNGTGYQKNGTYGHIMYIPFQRVFPLVWLGSLKKGEDPSSSFDHGPKL